jgi:hypothetical protein
MCWQGKWLLLKTHQKAWELGTLLPLTKTATDGSKEQGQKYPNNQMPLNRVSSGF